MISAVAIQLGDPFKAYYLGYLRICMQATEFILVLGKR